MISVTITQENSYSVTCTCEDSDDIRKVIRETIVGLQEAADMEKIRKPKKINLYFPGQEYSFSYSNIETANDIVNKMYDDIDSYGVVTISDLKEYFGLSTDIQDAHYGVNRKRDIVIKPFYNGCVIVMKNLIEVH